jgi:hypothetical protein
LAEHWTALEANIQAVQPLTKEEQALRLQARKCIDISQKLQKTLEGKGGVLRKVLRSGLKRSAIERSKAELLVLEQSLQTQILGDSWMRNRAAIVEQQQSFNNLDNRLQHFVAMVAAGHTQLGELIQREAGATRTHTTSEGSRIREHVTAETSKTTETVVRGFDLQEHDARLNKLLRSLSFPEINARRNQHSINSYKDTFQWIFEEKGGNPWKSFPSFLTSKSDNLYWISGKPGSGKSTLMKFLVNNSRTAELLKEWSDRNLVVSYFLWKRGSLMQRNRKGLLSSLAHQIIEKQPSILVSLTNINCWNKVYIDDWSDDELEQLLFQCLKGSTQSVCLFLDGLDEIDEHEGPFDLIDLIRKIRNQANTKVCLASRADREYFDEYSKLPMMKLQDLTESDIYHYAATELRKYCVNSRLDYNTETEKIVKLIVSRASGVFLWVYLVLRSLRKGIQSRGDDWSRLIDRVKTTPSELNKLYQDMWERLGDEVALYRKEAALYLNMVLDDPGKRPWLRVLAFANSPYPHDVIYDDRPIPPLQELNTEFERSRRHIEDYTAGLLEVYTAPDDGDRLHVDQFVENTDEQANIYLSDVQWIRFQIINHEDPDNRTKSLECLRLLQTFNSYSLQRVSFIHRSAADFFLESSEGQSILNYNQISLGEHRVKLIESRLFTDLVGTRSGRQNSGRIWLEVSFREALDEKQFDHLHRIPERAFYRLLHEIEKLRGRKLSSTVILHKNIKTIISLPEAVKRIVGEFLRIAASLGDLAAIQNYWCYVQRQGFELTTEFKSFILFAVIQQEFKRNPDPEPWGTVNHNMVSWLLNVGADPKGSEQAWNLNWWGGLHFSQKVSALEGFLLELPGYIIRAKETSDYLRLANTLEQLLAYRPNVLVERKLLYRQHVRLSASRLGSDEFSSDVDRGLISVRERLLRVEY